MGNVTLHDRKRAECIERTPKQWRTVVSHAFDMATYAQIYIDKNANPMDPLSNWAHFYIELAARMIQMAHDFGYRYGVELDQERDSLQKRHE